MQKNVFDLKPNTNNEDFNSLALRVFLHQYQNNEVYKAYVNSLKINAHKISHFSEIPFLPIGFFKTHKIVCNEVLNNAICFTSSGTTAQITSKHYVNNPLIYEESFKKGFELFYGSPKNYCILALLPNYLEREGSSLVYMFEHLIKDSAHPQSGFYLNNINELKNTITQLKHANKKVMLLGVTYALLDLAETGLELNQNFIVMETGGMKGKRKEMLKQELHSFLKKSFKVNAIHSEYGMTELLSQAYSKTDGVFDCPPWMKILIRDVNDPFSYVANGKTGGINVIDLANINSCSFIETKDLGKTTQNNGFEVIGRFDNSDLRGCNLMIQ